MSRRLFFERAAALIGVSIATPAYNDVPVSADLIARR